MTLFEYINKNIVRIKYDIRIGIISCATLKHWQIYSRYDYYRKLGNPVGNAVEYCCDDFNVAASWVFTIIKKMETELK